MSRSLPPLRVQVMRPAQWRALLRETGSEASDLRQSRRDFLGGAVKRRIAAGATTAEPEVCRPPGRLLPGDSPGHLMPVVPAIDTDRCDGCDACANLCPHGAISLGAADRGPAAYRIAAADCTGCGICVDVCERDAVTLCYVAPSIQVAVGLRAARCRRCGGTFHRPENQGDDDSLCRICVRVDHHRNLFQVFD
jgi:ferredoxin